MERQATQPLNPEDAKARLRAVATGGQAVSWVRFTLGDEVDIGISFFTGDETGLITGVTDFWPDPYEPPANRAHLTERF